jgi:hypothetical protein
MKNETQILAARLLAQILSAEENQPNSQKPEELSQILSKLNDLDSRLAAIENRFDEKPHGQQIETADVIPPVFPVFLHSSQERFAIEDREDETEKACRFEPGGKPCDHCALCTARGF